MFALHKVEMEMVGDFKGVHMAVTAYKDQVEGVHVQSERIILGLPRQKDLHRHRRIFKKAVFSHSKGEVSGTERDRSPSVV